MDLLLALLVTCLAKVVMLTLANAMMAIIQQTRLLTFVIIVTQEKELKVDVQIKMPVQDVLLNMDLITMGSVKLVIHHLIVWNVHLLRFVQNVISDQVLMLYIRLASNVIFIVMEDVQNKDMEDVTEMATLNAIQILFIVLNTLCVVFIVQVLIAKNVIMI
jgi:hypothetical protein